MTLKPIGQPGGYDVKFLVIGLGRVGLDAIAALTDNKTSGTTLLALSQDEAALRQSKADVGILLPSDHDALAAGDTFEQLRRAIEASNVCFIVAGGSDDSERKALAEIASIAHELDAFLIGWLGGADAGKALADDGSSPTDLADRFSVISLPDQPENGTGNQVRVANICRHITDLSGLISQPSLIGVDYADVRAILKAKGIVSAGMGHARGEDRANQAAEAALSDCMFTGGEFGDVENLLLNVVGGQDVELAELETALRCVEKRISSGPNVLVGMTSDPACIDEIRIQLMLTARAARN